MVKWTVLLFISERFERIGTITEKNTTVINLIDHGYFFFVPDVKNLIQTELLYVR